MDLDMSDVFADADRMFEEMLASLCDLPEIDLRVNRYDYGPDARAGEPHSIAVVETCDYLLVNRCYYEFGEHDHDPAECQRTMDMMSAPMPDETDYSGWYGGEQGYRDGLRWSDFI